MLKDDPLANVLFVDLSTKRFHVERREDLFSRYIGGGGGGERVVGELLPPGGGSAFAGNSVHFVGGGWKPGFSCGGQKEGVC